MTTLIPVRPRKVARGANVLTHLAPARGPRWAGDRSAGFASERALCGSSPSSGFGPVSETVWKIVANTDGVCARCTAKVGPDDQITVGGRG